MMGWHNRDQGQLFYALAIRRAPQLGQKPRRLQLNATNRCLPEPDPVGGVAAMAKGLFEALVQAAQWCNIGSSLHNQRSRVRIMRHPRSSGEKMIARNVAGLALWGAMLVFSSNAGAQSAQQAMEEAAKVYSDWVVMMAEITKGIEVKDSDFRDYLAHWEDLNKLDLADMEEENPQQFKQNVRSAIADPQYRSWAVSRGLDPEAFIRRSMRINSLFMVQMQEAQEAGSAQQYAQHAAMVEKQCAQVDAETCQQMRAMGAASKAMAESMRKARRQIPPATSREQALFDKYGPELEAQMLAEDEDDESGYGGYEEDY